MKHLYKISLLLLVFLMPFTATAFEQGIFTFQTLGDGTTVEVWCFYNYNGHVTIPETVTYNGTTYTVTKICSFKGCNMMTGITIPSTITTILSSAFSGCSGLTRVDITDLAAWCEIDFGSSSANPLYYAHHLFLNGEEVTNLIIPNNVIAISNKAFVSCEGLTSVTIGNSVSSIGERAFESCTELTSVTIGNSVKSISDYTFTDCTKLKSVDFGTSVKSIGKGVFANCTSLSNVIIPNSVTSIYRCAFWCCYDLSEIIIPNSVSFIDEYAFDGTAWFANQPDGMVYAGLVAYQYKGDMPDGSSIVLRDGTLGIAGNAFGNRKELISITIPHTVTTICSGAFNGCSGLTSVNIPNSVTSIGGGCMGGENPFPNCNGLKYISVESGNPKYDSRNNCNAIIETQTNNLISGCQYTTIPNSVTSIDICAFNGCKGLANIMIPNSVITIGNSAFSGCEGLSNLSIPNSVISIGNYAFYGCSGLSNLIIGNAVTSIGDRAFYGCERLTTLIIPKSITSIGKYAFQDCSSLETLLFEAISCSGFSGGFEHPFYNTVISTIKTGDDVRVIPANFANGLADLTYLTIGKSVSAIGKNAFSDLYNIEAVTCAAETPPSWEDAAMFATNVYNHTPLGVPLGSERAYMSDQSWGQFVNIIGIEIPDEIMAISISLNQSQLSLLVGGTSQLIAKVLPDSTTNKIVDWMSSDPSVAVVDATGLVTAVAPGSVTITATTTDGSNLSASCVVTVTEDLSEYDNYLSMNDAEAFHGDTIVIPVKMTNAENIIAFQTDIFLPDGLEIVQEDGEYLIDASSRMTRTHSIMSNEVSSGAVRVLCYSSNYKPFTGNSGDELFYITVKVADDAEGDYFIQLKNTLLTNTDFVDLAAPDVAATVNVKAYHLGDANNSGTVTITDVVVTAQYVLEMNPSPFIFAAADVNFDNNITVADVSRIVWMVLNPSLGAPRRAPVLWNNGDSMSGEGVTLATGETRTVSIMLDNEMDYSAFQFDLTLPEGLTASNFALTDRAGSHTFDVNILANGKTRALCYSPMLTAIRGHEGAVLTFDVTATTAIDGAINVDGIELVTTDCQTVHLDAFAIGVNNATSVNVIAGGKTVARVDYFNLAGQQIDRPESGVTLVVTTYTDGTRTTTKIFK